MKKFSLLFILLLLADTRATSQTRRPGVEALEHGLMVREQFRRSMLPWLETVLKTGSPALIAKAAVAAGRTGRAAHVPVIAGLLGDQNGEIRAAAGYAAGLLHQHQAMAAPLVEALLAEKKRRPAVAMLRSLGRFPSRNHLRILATRLRWSDDPAVRQNAALAIGIMFQYPGNTDLALPEQTRKQLLSLITSGDNGAAEAAWAISRAGADGAISELRAALDKTTDPPAALYLMHSLAVPAGRQLLIQWLQTRDPAPAPAGAGHLLQEAAMDLLSTAARPDLCPVLGPFLRSSRPGIQLAAISAAGASICDDKATMDRLSAMRRGAITARIRQSALQEELSLLPPEQRLALIDSILGGKQRPLQITALQAMAAWPLTKKKADRLLPWLGSPHQEIREAALRGMASRQPAPVSVRNRLVPVLRRILGQRQAGQTLLAARLIREQNLSQLDGNLAALFQHFRDPARWQVRLEILRALRHASRDYAWITKAALEDPVADIRRYAQDQWPAAAATPGSGEDFFGDYPLPPIRDLDDALARIVVFKTTRGTLRIRLNPSAPVSAWRFVNLVRQGFYDGQPIRAGQRQLRLRTGADPASDKKMPGWLLRDELSAVLPRAGTVLIEGDPDRGGPVISLVRIAGFHAWNEQTVLGEVIDGLHLLQDTGPDDRILSSSLETIVALRQSKAKI